MGLFLVGETQKNELLEYTTNGPPGQNSNTSRWIGFEAFGYQNR